MDIYRISTDYTFALVSVESITESAQASEIESDSTNYLNNFQFFWDYDNDEPIPDFAIIMSQVLCCSEIVKEMLLQEFPSLQTYPIKISAQQYFTLHNITTIKDVINLKASKVTYYSTGDIDEIKKCVFRPYDYPLLFKVPEICNSIFCTDAFKEVVCNNSWSGLYFTPCKIKSKSWFNI